MADITVRPGMLGDVNVICRICDSGFRYVASGLLPPDVVDRQAANYYNPERVAGEVSPDRLSRFWNGYVVAEVAAEVVGAAGGGLDDTDLGHLYVIYLDLKSRGRGIGSRLLDVVSDQQRELGATRQRVAVLEGNRYGLPFYLARGFRQVDRRRYPADDVNGVPELVLERPL